MGVFQAQDVEIVSGISPDDVARTITVVSIFILVIFLGTLALSVQHNDFLKVLFEVVSATSTVGLSLGLTQSLTTWGQLIIIIMLLDVWSGYYWTSHGLSAPTNTIRYPEDRYDRLISQ